MTKTARKLKAVDVDAIWREDQAEIDEINRQSIRSYVAVMRRFAETIVADPILWQAGAPGLETKWLPPDVGPFKSNARAVLSHAAVIENHLDDPAAALDVAVHYADCCGAFERMMRIFDQRDTEAGRTANAGKRSGAAANRERMADAYREWERLFDTGRDDPARYKYVKSIRRCAELVWEASSKETKAIGGKNSCYQHLLEYKKRTKQE